MKLERSKNTKRNILIGVINKSATLILPFVVQTFFIRTLGMEYAGLRGVFSSLLQVLSLAELGFGSAMVFNMYRAIAKDDDDLICALLRLYRKIYRYIGLAILLIAISLIPFIPKMVNHECPSDVNIYIIYMMYVANTTISYWMFGYKNSILNAFQRQDIIGLIQTVVQIVFIILQIVYLLLCRDFYIFLALQIAATIITNIVVAVAVNRLFPQYNCRGDVPKEIVSGTMTKMVGLILYKICGVTRNSFDSIFVSMFIGLVVSGMYSNYLYVLGAVMGLLSILTSSMLAGVGNSIETESVDKNYADFKRVDFIYMILAGWCMVCMLCLYQPFMKLWAGPEFVFPFEVTALFSLYFYLLCMGNIRALYADAAGLWWESRYRLIVESLANIVLNYLFVKRWGVFGILLSTNITLFFIGWPWSAYVLFEHYFKSGLRSYLVNHFVYMSITIIVCASTYACCRIIPGNDWFLLIIRAVICCIVTPLIYYSIYCRSEIYKNSKEWFLIRVRRW